MAFLDVDYTPKDPIEAKDFMPAELHAFGAVPMGFSSDIYMTASTAAGVKSIDSHGTWLKLSVRDLAGYASSVLTSIFKVFRRLPVPVTFGWYQNKKRGTIRAHIYPGEQGIEIAFDGYGTKTGKPGTDGSAPIFIGMELEHPVVYIWGDIRQEDPTWTIRLDGALEVLHDDNQQ